MGFTQPAIDVFWGRVLYCLSTSCHCPELSCGRCCIPTCSLRFKYNVNDELWALTLFWRLKIKLKPLGEFSFSSPNNSFNNTLLEAGCVQGCVGRYTAPNGPLWRIPRPSSQTRPRECVRGPEGDVSCVPEEATGLRLEAWTGILQMAECRWAMSWTSFCFNTHY